MQFMLSFNRDSLSNFEILHYVKLLGWRIQVVMLMWTFDRIYPALFSKFQ